MRICAEHLFMEASRRIAVDVSMEIVAAVSWRQTRDRSMAHTNWTVLVGYIKPITDISKCASQESCVTELAHPMIYLMVASQ